MNRRSLHMGYLGLEPRAYRLKAEYSTIELATRYLMLFMGLRVFFLVSTVGATTFIKRFF